MASALGAIPTVSAATITIMDSSSCGSIGGSWSSGTCTLSTSYTLTSGNALEIPSGTTLVIGASGTIVNDGTITVDSGGVLTIQSSNLDYGIQNYGTLNVAGTANLENTAYYSIWNPGTITNTGTINVKTSGSFGTIGIYSIFLSATQAGVITNSGVINVENTGSTYGIYSGIATITNTGIINVENSGELGIYSISSTFTNTAPGRIDVENTGAYGIDNNGPLTNTGTITVGPAPDAILNQATITNECGGVINGPGTIVGGYTQVSGCAPTGVPEFPISGLGPLLLSAMLLPVLVIMSRRFRASSP